MLYNLRPFTLKPIVFNLSLNSPGEFLASSSCDGSVKVWDLQTSVSVASWNVVPKTNSFSSSQTLCRMAWSSDGQYLLVPVGLKVHAYARKDWQIHHSLEHESIKEVCVQRVQDRKLIYKIM